MLNFLLYHTPFFYLIQSLWRDEAFSYFMAKPNILQVVSNTAHDFNPPLYYLLLHFWIIIAGRSDELLRILSFTPFAASVYVAYLLGTKLFSRKFALFVAVFTFFNPMLLYYAFEIRMYSFYALFVFCSLYFFYIKSWKWYTITSVLGLYTHSFFPLVTFSYLLYIMLTQPRRIQRKTLFPTFKPLLFYLPWLPVLITQFIQSKDSWLFPVDFQLVKSVLGNLFTNYEGTPGGFWQYTAVLSGLIITFLLFGLIKNRKSMLLLLLPLLAPLLLILGYSTVRRQIYVNRYLIFAAVFEIMGISMGIYSIKKRIFRWSAAILWLAFVISFNILIIPYHKKTDFKTAFNQINKMAKPQDFVFSKTPISFLESAYYYRDAQKVFVYNPDNISIPNYIGITVTFPDISKSSLPQFPSRIFMINDDASYELLINKS